MSPTPNPLHRRASIASVILVLLMAPTGAAMASPRGLDSLRLEPVVDIMTAVQMPDDLDDLPLVFPQDPSVTHFDNTWGNRRSGGRRHTGTDLMAPKMGPVYAVADGIVTTMKRGGSAGWWIGIEHAGGLESWYMHLNNDAPGTDNGRADRTETYAAGLNLGDFVTAGQLIGYVGDSGNAEGSGSHTHFELHVNGTAINPYPFLVAAYERATVVQFLEVIEKVTERVE